MSHSGGEDVLTFYDSRRYRLATVFALAHPYGFVRIMSSYRWTGGRYRYYTVLFLQLDLIYCNHFIYP